MTKSLSNAAELPSVTPPAEVSTGTRLFTLLFLAAHLLAAAGVLRLMPGGFPLDHPRLWANRVLPAVVAIYAVTGAVLVFRRRWPLVTAMLIASPLVGIAAAVSGLIVFPISGRKPGLAALAMAVMLLVAIRQRLYRHWPNRRMIAATSLLPLLIGAALPLTQRAPAPDTRPIAGVTPPPGGKLLAQAVITQKLAEGVRVVPSTGQLMLDRMGRSIWVQPLLTFTSRSPDRCWTSLAPRFDRLGPQRQLVDFVRVGESVSMGYLDDGHSRLQVRADAGDIDLTAESTFPRPVYSHLNSYAEIVVHGHRRLSIAFSPAPNAAIDVAYSEYPVGWPMRAAYLGGDSVFRIVQASSGEKGPFHELAAGKLAREDPLALTLLDGGKPFARITLLDFAQQAGTQLSPTGGWGLPVNAIEFTLTSGRDDSPASIFVSLAATSVGRGWDSVGHAAGTYRNRMHVEYLKP